MKKVLLLISIGFLICSQIFAQLTQINNNNSLNPSFPLPNGKTILVSDMDSSVWVTDGTIVGTFKLSTTIKLINEGGFLPGKLIFSGTTAATGIELFMTDGTVAGTILLNDIFVGINSSSPDDDFANLGGFIYFTASRPAEGRELWRTDGTPGGTVLFKDLIPGPVSGIVLDSSNLFSNGTYLLFSANTTTTGTELWSGNGTSAGTNPLADINPGAPSSFPQGFNIFGNMVLFQANDGVHGIEWWKTNGTSGGTSLLKDINPGPENGFTDLLNFPFIFVFNNKAFFMANDGVNGEEIFVTDGTQLNTFILKDIQTGPFASTNVFNAVAIGNKFFFTSSDLISRFEMWQSDGTPSGTTLFKSFTPNDFSGIPFIFRPFQFDINTGVLSQPLFQGNKFFFTAGSVADGVELWVTDGTPGGTSIVRNIGPGGADGVEIGSYAYTSLYLYFVANNGASGRELWRSDGASSGIGTTLVADINPGLSDSDPDIFFFVNNGKLLISADNGDIPFARDLYVLDGLLPLPVNLLQFSVVDRQADAFIQWSTTGEINSRDFIVQRSDDGITFANIGKISAMGISTSKINYNFIDAGIINSGKAKLYYRLNQRNRDGSESLSRIITLDLKGRHLFTIRLLQNPVKTALPVMVTGGGQRLVFSIKDYSGKTLYTSQAANLNGFISIPVSNLATGSYILVVDGGQERKAFKFFKD